MTNSDATLVETTPREIEWTRFCLFALAALYLFSLVVFFMQRGDIADSLAASSPQASQNQLETIVTAIMVAGSIFHLVLVGLFVWFATEVRTGGKRLLYGLTIVLLFATVGSAFSFISGPVGPDKILNVVSVLLKLVVLMLLWIPRTSRNHFGTAMRERVE